MSDSKVQYFRFNDFFFQIRALKDDFQFFLIEFMHDFGKCQCEVFMIEKIEYFGT